MDQIVIKDLEVFGNHGVFKEENMLGQKFLVSATMYADLSKAQKDDDLLESIDYGEACKFITSFMQKNTFKLIETAASNLAEEILLRSNKIKRIDIEIKKPWAPIGLPLQYVSVKVSRQWHKAYIAVGSNMGDKEKYINDAIAIMEADAKCRVGKVSDLIITEPVGPIEQDDFLNGCLELDTIYRPLELLHCMQAIEQLAKRDRKIHWGPRTLDLDILFYDDLVMSEPELVIPHPYMNKRMFVLEPMCQIAPYYVHPLLKKRMNVLKKQMEEDM